MAPADTLRVDLALAHRPGEVQLLALQLPAGATAADALRAARAQLPDAATLDTLTLALWGRACAPDAPLHEGDRLALLRGLQVDPKEARRLRYRRDGIRPKRRGA